MAELPGEEGPVSPAPALPPAGVLAWLAGTSFILVLVAFVVVAERLHILNLPFGLIATSLLVFGASGLLFPAALNLRPAAFTGLSRFRPGAVLLGFAIGVANMPLAGYLMGVARELLPREWTEISDAMVRLLIDADTPARIAFLVAAGVAAPIGEELFFRGWFQSALAVRIARFTSTLAVAIAFAAMHFDPVGFVARIELGLLFGLARARTGSLWPAVSMHAAHNLISMLVLFATADPVSELSEPFRWGKAGLLAAGALGATVLLWRLLPRDTAEESSAALRPADERLPTFALTLRPALRVLTATFVLGALTLALLLGWGRRLPGGDLSRRAPEQPPLRHQPPTLPE